MQRFSARRARRSTVAGLLAALTLAGGAALQASDAHALPVAAPQPSTSTTAVLNVRDAPRSSAAKVGALPRGATVQLTGVTRGGYSQIMFRGERRWVATRYLAGLGAQADAPAAEPTPLAALAGGAERTWWQPKPGASFHIQYTGKVSLEHPVDVYNLDAERTTKAEVDRLKARGVKTICYINAGAFEDWRSDKGKFPGRVLGQPLDGWPGERWLDIRQRDVLVPIMAARMDMCAAKGFDAVDPDNTDGWQQRTGFSISGDDQIAYQRALADEAHKRGMAIGLKNNIEQIGQIGPFVDFAVNEQCGEYNECGAYAGFLASGKAVFNIEYGAGCASRPPGMSSITSDLALSGVRRPC